MYHIEQVINGVLCYRNIWGRWSEMSPEQLTQRIIDLQNQTTK